MDKSNGEVYTCPLVDWFQFHTCTVITCKNFSKETKSRCIELDRVEPEGKKFISDAEIHFYKFKSASISPRLVQHKRKIAAKKVEAILMLKLYVEYIQQVFSREAKGIFTLPLLIEAEKTSWQKFKQIGWKNWMWEYFLDDELWIKFCKAKRITELERFHLIGMKEIRYEKLVTQFNNPF